MMSQKSALKREIFNFSYIILSLYHVYAKTTLSLTQLVSPNIQVLIDASYAYIDTCQEIHVKKWQSNWLSRTTKKNLLPPPYSILNGHMKAIYSYINGYAVI